MISECLQNAAQKFVSWNNSGPEGVALELHIAHTEKKMSHRLIIAAAFAFALSATAHAQQPTTTSDATARSSVLTAIPSNATTVTNYYKQNVYDPSDSKIGEIVDVLVGNEGKIDALIVSVGGFLGMDSKDVAIPFNAVRATNKNGAWYLTMNATKDALKAAPGYKYDKARANWVPA
jgi:sporulation protein YlmC with PRC-barrel domain